MKSNNILIFGDSYSTFDGFIPDGYSVYYPSGSADVKSVKDTWWHMVAEETDSQIIQNNSWSGSTVCYTCYGGEDCSESSSFIFRLKQLINDGFFEKNDINTVYVFGGTNDSWANSPIGDSMYSDWKKEDLYSVLPAFGYFIDKLKKLLPKANIVCIINTELKPEIANGFEATCKQLEVNCVVLHDIDKAEGHPTKKGMLQIKEQILNR